MSDSRVYGDWGSTRLRLWRMRDGKVEEERSGPGIVGLAEPAAAVLATAVAPWLDAPPERMIFCGMVGARGGLREVPYLECPVDAAEWRRQINELEVAGIPVRIGAGLTCRDQSGRPDVMRGEEAQVFGIMRLRPELERGRRTIVHPGTHAKWIALEDGCITGFRTFFTGELFALLGRSSLAGPAEQDEGAEQEGFAVGLRRARDDRGLLGGLFEARSAQVRDGCGSAWARGFLSGLLIGTEAAEQRRAGFLPDQVLVLGEPALTRRYVAALAEFGVATEAADGEEAVLAGLELLDADD